MLIIKYTAFISAFIILGYILGKNILRNESSLILIEYYCLSTVLGWSLLAVILMSIGFLGLLNRLSLSVALILLFIFILRNRNIKPYEIPKIGYKALWSQPCIYFLAAITLAYLFSLYYLALYPVTGWDAVSYHLPVAREFVSQGRIVFMPFIRSPVYPQMIELFFSLALIFGSPPAASFTQYSMAIILFLLIYSFAKNNFSRNIGLLSAIIFITSPLVTLMGTVAYVEVGTSLFCFAAFYTLCLWVKEKRLILAITSGILWGIALGSKYYAILFFILALFLITISFWNRMNKKHLLSLITAALLVALPWYLRNKYYSGDWFFPLFLKKAGAKGLWDAEDLGIQLADIRAHGLGYGIKEFLMLPLNLLKSSSKFGEKSLGFFLLLSFFSPLLIKKGTKLLRAMILISFIYVLLWFKYFQVTRYLFPILPFLAILSARLLEKVCFYSRYCIFLLIALALILGLDDVFKTLKAKGSLPLTSREESEYLARHIPTYKAITFLNKNYDKDTVVYGFYDEGSIFYHKNKIISDVYGPVGYQKILRHLADQNVFYNFLKSYRVKYFLIRKDKICINDINNKFKSGKFKIVYEDQGSLVIEIPL